MFSQSRLLLLHENGVVTKQEADGSIDGIGGSMLSVSMMECSSGCCTAKKQKRMLMSIQVIDNLKAFQTN
jgi:hypothetical protein